MNVDIVIPVFNGDKHLTETLESVQNQSIGFDNVIIVDDASEDKSLEIISKFVSLNSNFISIENSNNKGLGESLRNATIYSNADFICILGQDDCLPPNYLEKTLSYLNSDVSIAHSDYKLIDDNGFLLPQKEPVPLRIPFAYKLIKGNYIYLQTLGNHISTVGIFLNTKHLKIIDPFKTIMINSIDESIIRTYDEYLTWLLLANVGKIIHIRDNQPYYRLHADNMTKKLVLDEDYWSLYRENRRLAFKVLLKKEPLISIILFIVYVYIPVLVALKIQSIFKSFNLRLFKKSF